MRILEIQIIVRVYHTASDSNSDSDSTGTDSDSGNKVVRCVHH